MLKRKENQEEKFDCIIKEFLDENLNCRICDKPKSNQKQCEKCCSLFCEKCITESLAQYPFCPSCKALPLVLRKLNPILQASYEFILLRCPNKDCEEIITTSTFEFHKKVCKYLEITCTNQNCEYKVKRKDLDDHLKECSKNHKSSKCTRCSQSFEKNERHDCLVNYQQLLKSFTDEKTSMQKLVISTQILQSNMLLTSQIIKSQINQSIQKKKNEKLCSNNHNLQWVRSLYNKQCFKCRETRNVVRYICQQCDEKYCQSCVKPTFNGNICPTNHTMEYANKASPTLRCDFCREYPYEKKIAVYSDRECNFDICKTCFIALSFDS